MILINLLPNEYRQRRRTPIKLMAAVASSVAINTSLIAFLAWTAFGAAAEVKSELQVLRDNHEGLKAQVAYHEDLEQESKLFESRENTLGELTSKRVSWTMKVDELTDIINAGGDGEKYLIWLDGLTVDQKENRRSNSFGQMKSTGHSGSSSIAHVANFLEDLEEHEFIRDFFKPRRPEGTQTIVDPDLMPSEVWSFPLELALRSPEERAEFGAPSGEAPAGDAQPKGNARPANKTASKPAGKKAGGQR